MSDIKDISPELKEALGDLFDAEAFGYSAGIQFVDDGFVIDKPFIDEAFAKEYAENMISLVPEALQPELSAALANPVRKSEYEFIFPGLRCSDW